MNDRYLKWYKLNLMGLIGAGYYQPEDLEFVIQGKPVLVINPFELPSNFKQNSTKLMIIFPHKENIFNSKPDRFYVNKGLRLANGEKPDHIYENDFFNDLSKKGWARYSFHLKKWSPRRDIVSGTTIYDILEAVYNGLAEL